MKPLTREEILTVYEAGPEAVIQLVNTLTATIEALKTEVAKLVEQAAQQSEQVVKLQERVKTLEDRAAKDSHNSSKPPSSDGFVKPKSQRQKSDRPVGGQKGHPGHTLKMQDNPEHIIHHAVSHCGGCGCSLETTPVNDYERRQVFDLPPLKIETTEHRAEKKCCPHCGFLNKAVFPENIEQPVQYGPNLKAIAVYLSQYQLLPYERTSELFFDLFGVNISQATLVNANQSCYEILEPVAEKIKEHIIFSGVVHFDETGLYIDGKRHWLHGASTKTLTYYGAHPKRGNEATNEIGILPHFQGTAIHDFWKSYFKYDCRHALCNAHHLRELTAIYELDRQQWSKDLIDLLLEIKKAVSQQTAYSDMLDLVQLQNYEERYNRIIAQGLAENPPPILPGKVGKRGKTKQTKAKNLLDRLQQHRPEVLAFMYDFQVPFDNNQAERDIRMTKVKQKISGTFRSQEGANTFCRIRGYISTVKKNSISVIDAIKAAFDGNPLYPEVLTVSYVCCPMRAE
jgi:transposase